ncbi:hypothetical protein [Natrarchaeobaculum sulfurireducens]|uniref:Uncharacterized protein n=1 Tax=Natrarchaeobaculum sulfurireducens TaxID=2044521 RepID=A0A346PS19_9EURY|nr:hypothetical protein [Natrarchaeobaculum sulfurireducens]AXR82314.1 hypothetical protein AArcMg_2318 [Natrarchaeobaculum sulfurireducens]
MVDLTAFGLEPQESSDVDNDDDLEGEVDPVWSKCVGCSYVGYEVKCRRQSEIPLCPDCFAEREGLR